MKKKVIIGLSFFSLLFFLSGIYIITTIERTTTKLDNLVRLHRIEILREHLLIQVKRTQSDLYLKNTRYARSIDTIVTHVRNMSNVVSTCFNCHHTENVTEKLDRLRNQIEQYKSALSRVLTIRANAKRLEAEEDNAVGIGTELITELNNIITLTNKTLEERRQGSLEDMARAKIIVNMLLVITPFAALVLSAVFIRGFTKPVDELLTATRRIKSGDLSYKIEGLRDEFGEVATSFNEMAASLKEQCQKMQWAEQLVVLGELAGGLAHEIKNPLAGIKASTAVLSEEESLSAENKDILLKVIEQINRIENLLKSLLNFARPPKPQIMSVDVNEVLDATISLAQKHPLFSSPDSKSIVIEKRYDSHLPKISADPLQLQQVFMNLLLNAADAMPAGGTITARTAHDETARPLSIRIGDTGMGIDTAVIDKIFQPFFTTKPKGTGLGLAITKRLVEQHGGSIGVESNPGGGVLFTITLPTLPGGEGQRI